MNFHDARAAVDGPKFAFEDAYGWSVACDRCRGARRMPDQAKAESAAERHVCKADRPLRSKR